MATISGLSGNRKSYRGYKKVRTNEGVVFVPTKKIRQEMPKNLVAKTVKVKKYKKRTKSS